MTREELIRNLKYTMKKHENDKVPTFGTNISIMCKNILDYLEQEPCNDAISRRAAIDAILKIHPADTEYDCTLYDKVDVMYVLKNLPPVNPQESKTGHWIPCSERLPEICQEDCHGNITFSKTVLTTQIYGDGYVYVGIDKYTTNNGGGWLTEVPFDNPEECCKVIAWMPLPEPYKAETEEEE